MRPYGSGWERTKETLDGYFSESLGSGKRIELESVGMWNRLWKQQIKQWAAQFNSLNSATSESAFFLPDDATISFAMIFETHLSSEELRIYSHGLFSDAKLEETEDHLLVCQSCQDKLVLACQDEQRVKSAAGTQSANRLRSIHITEDGPIFAAMRRGAAGKRIARHWGRQLSGCQICSSVQEADEYLTESFWQMFPNHVCSKQCIDLNVSDT